MMTDTLVGVSPPTPEPVAPAESESSGGSERELSPAELAVIEGLVRRAREDGVALTGPAGLGRILAVSATVGVRSVRSVF